MSLIDYTPLGAAYNWYYGTGQDSEQSPADSALSSVYDEVKESVDEAIPDVPSLPDTSGPVDALTDLINTMAKNAAIAGPVVAAAGAVSVATVGYVAYDNRKAISKAIAKILAL